MSALVSTPHLTLFSEYEYPSAGPHDTKATKRCPGLDIKRRWVSQFEASHYMLPGFCRANKTIRNFLACKCRMLPPRCSRQSLRTVLWMGCKNFIMLPSLLIAIQHYNMMNIAGKDYCIISNSNRFDDEKSELYCLRIYTMS